MSSENDYDWLRLADGESIVWSGQPRRVSVVKTAFAVSVLAVVAGLFRLALVAVVLPVGAIIVAGTYLKIVNTDYVVTDASVYRRTGVFGETVERASIAKIQNVDLSKGVLGTQFGFGTVEVSTAGGRAVEIGNVEGPDDLKDLVDEYAKRSEGVGMDAEGAGAGLDAGEVARLYEEARALRDVAESLEDTFAGGDA